jgi:transcriptional regulator with XRE-family HTH domain
MVIKNCGRRIVKTLSAWLLEEIQQRHMSIREFARHTGVTHVTLLNILEAEPGTARYPSVETLVKLARVTGADLFSLVAMLSPEDTATRPDALILANRIKNLSPEAQAVLEDWLMGRLSKNSDHAE